jgi:L-alanine-DL-glutamate epimerase-like enolase superfamily enzyme
MQPVAVTVEQRRLKRSLRVSHTVVETVDVVTLRLARDGVVGRGEVTAGPWKDETGFEIAAAAQRMLATLPDRIPSVRDIERHIVTIASPAARLLVEMALLDLVAQAEAAPLWDVLDLPEPPAQLELFHTVSVGEPPPPARPRLKVKLGGAHDDATIDALTRVDSRILVDVNRGWSGRDVERLVPRLANLRLVAIEDPVADLALLPHVRALLDAPVILDEGVVEPDAALEIADGINIKLLRTGSLLAARDALLRTRAAGKLAMLGCYVETPRAIAYAAQLAGLAAIHDLDGDTFLAE